MPKVSKCNKWKCGVCRKEQHTTMDKCPNCGAPKAKGKSLVKLHGDWICLHCSVNDFARRLICYGCRRPKYLTCTFPLKQKFKCLYRK